MQKNNSGSILIWSIFFLIFISFSFLYISNNIKKEITLQKDIKNENKIDLYFNKTFTWILLNLQKKQITISNTWIIKLISWWPILIDTWTLLTNETTLSSWTYLLSNLGWYSSYEVNLFPKNVKNPQKIYKKIGDLFLFKWYKF